ncbi:MAG: hypothetical protein O3C40_28170 [Planctomycetota bacterium]|nr:hypothetical protein [Planctomycetota bacterium]
MNLQRLAARHNRDDVDLAAFQVFNAVDQSVDQIDQFVPGIFADLNTQRLTDALTAGTRGQ